MESKQLSEQLKNLESLTREDTVDQVQILADIVYKLTECIDVRFHGVDSEHELEVKAAELQKSNMLLGGKYFTILVSLQHSHTWKTSELLPCHFAGVFLKSLF